MKLEKDRDVLSLKGVSVRYVDSTVALHPTSLDVKQGEFLVLLGASGAGKRSEEHTSELQSRPHLVCRLLLEKKKKKNGFTKARVESVAMDDDASTHNGV